MVVGGGVPGYTMRQLAAFVAVGETGTIRGAAERLGLSQSTVSAAVSELERVLKADLCVRRRAHGVRLTPTGEAVLVRARLVLRQAEELSAEAVGVGGEVSGPVVVGCYPSLGPTVVPGLIQAFTERFPRARVVLREATQNRLEQMVAAGEVDVVIAYDLWLPQEWSRRVLGTRAPVVALAGGHRLAQGSAVGVDLAELAGEPMVMLEAPPSAEHALQVCSRAGFAPRVAYRTESFETARALVGRGLGWALLLQRPAVDVTYEGWGVVVLPVVEPVVERVGVVVAWHREAVVSPSARAFVGLALQGMAGV